jgi:hypothetical protein
MRIVHQDVEYSLEDDWWTEAGMVRFEPPARSYRASLLTGSRQPHIEVAVKDVEPLRRNLTHGVFNDGGESGSARQRVVNILCAFREDVALPPVEVARLPSDALHAYRLKHGAHRFYCSIAAGFSHVPAIEVEDWSVEA